MHTVPTPDMGAGYLMVGYGTWALIGWGLPAIIVEAVLLHTLLPL